MRQLMFALLLLYTVPALAADTTYFQQDGTNGTTDDGILRETSSAGEGASTRAYFRSFTGDRRWAIFRWDSCHVAMSGKTVSSAWFIIRIGRKDSDTLTDYCARVKESWRETGNAYHSSPGWAYRDSAVTTWGTAGCPNDGTSAYAAIEGYAHIDTSGMYRFNLITQTVQAWIDSPAVNEGIILYGSPSTPAYDTIYFSEFATAAYRPRLAIVTTSGGTSSTVVVNGTVRVNGNVRIGQ